MVFKRAATPPSFCNIIKKQVSLTVRKVIKNESANETVYRFDISCNGEGFSTSNHVEKKKRRYFEIYV